MKRLFTIIYLIPSMAAAGMRDAASVKAGLALRLDIEDFLTDKQGVASAERVANTQVGRLVSIYRTDGYCYKGQITSEEEGEGYFKVFGKVLNSPDITFGFYIVKGGHFAGAILDKKENTTYVLEFSPAHKGYIFVKSTKYDKATTNSKDKSIYDDCSVLEKLT
jgi:hypothetical protein